LRSTMQDGPNAIRDPDLSRTAREAAGVLLYGLAWWLGYHVSTDYWFLPAGLRFACLLATSRRLWIWLALSEFVAIGAIVLQSDGYRTWSGFVLGVVAPWMIHAMVVSVADRRGALREPDTPRRMGRLLLAMLAAALSTAVLLSTMRYLENPSSFSDPLLYVLRFAIGDYIAILIVVPIWLHASARRFAGAGAILFDLVWLFVPLLALVLLVPALRSHAVSYVGLLALVPMVFMVFRHGWEGAGWSLACTSVALYAIGEALDLRVTREIMQVFLALVGSISLMLGAAIVALRRAHDALASRNDALAVQAGELRALSERLVRAQEDEQRRIARELQGELEQGMTALGTRLGMLARTPLEPTQIAAVDSLRSLAQDIHASVREVLHHMRPALLDRHGLEHALRAGPIRDLLADAEVQFALRVRGSLAALDLDVQGAIYRICQEAAIDCVRQRRGQGFSIDLRTSGLKPGQQAVELDVIYGPISSAHADGDDMIPAPDLLPGTRDRVIALGGRYRCSTADDAIRHHVEFVAVATGAPRA
jgi:glucose-6-phosphate-specific signal transduction histidine kinase